MELFHHCCLQGPRLPCTLSTMHAAAHGAGLASSCSTKRLLVQQLSSCHRLPPSAFLSTRTSNSSRSSLPPPQATSSRRNDNQAPPSPTPHQRQRSQPPTSPKSRTQPPTSRNPPVPAARRPAAPTPGAATRTPPAPPQPALPAAQPPSAKPPPTPPTPEAVAAWEAEYAQAVEGAGLSPHQVGAASLNVRSHMRVHVYLRACVCVCTHQAVKGAPVGWAHLFARAAASSACVFLLVCLFTQAGCRYTYRI